MYFHIDDLEKAIKAKDYRIKNYYETFGFVVIKNFIRKNELSEIKVNYDQEFRRRRKEFTFFGLLKNRLGFDGPKEVGFRALLRKFIRKPDILCIPNFIDENINLTNFFFNDKKKSIYDYFLDKNWLYMGSDGQQYIRGGGFAWHRDWFLEVPQTKIFFLIDPLIFLGGEFKLIPGSSNIHDIYTHNLSKMSNWPMPNDFPEGVSDGNFLPRIKNPRLVYDPKKINIPHVSLKLKFGDALFFDQRNFHCLSGNYPRFDIKMMSLLMSKNPFQFSDSNPALKKNTKENLARRVIDLMVSERNHCRCDNTYGSSLTNSVFFKKNKNHFFDAKKDKKGHFNLGTINLGKNKFFTSKVNFDYYKKIGITHKKNYASRKLDNKEMNKMTSTYDFDDFHLGLMSDEFKNFE